MPDEERIDSRSKHRPPSTDIVVRHLTEGPDSTSQIHGNTRQCTTQGSVKSAEAPLDSPNLHETEGLTSHHEGRRIFPPAYATRYRYDDNVLGVPRIPNNPGPRALPHENVLPPHRYAQWTSWLTPEDFIEKPRLLCSPYNRLDSATLASSRTDAAHDLSARSNKMHSKFYTDRSLQGLHVLSGDSFFVRTTPGTSVYISRDARQSATHTP